MLNDAPAASSLALAAAQRTPRELAHARAWRARGMAWPPEGPPADEILDSWVRCVDAGLDAAARAPLVMLEAAELAHRRERFSVARRLAQAELETLAQQIAGSNFLLCFADREGVILDLVQDNRFSMSSDTGILAGSCWSEAIAGTNGLGTALALGRPMAVSGMEHYFHELGRVSCTAAPVRDAAGEIVGVLDASSYFESRQRHTLALVQMAATHIENGLLLHQMRPHWVLAVHPRSEFLGTLSAGLIAFSAEGLLLALNARGRQLLQGLQAEPGTRFDELFGEPFERVLPRLARGGELRLRDLMGSTLVASCMNRPPMSLVRARGPVAAGPELAPEQVKVVPKPAPKPSAAPIAAQVATPVAAPAAQAVLEDPAVQAAYDLAARAAAMGVAVLIQGETGSGKELLARHVHACGTARGRRGAFVAVNCGAMPAELFESELFGHVRGAFTGARREGSAGLIASADGGTLLLDEVRELPLATQAALLRFLDDQLVRPVGGSMADQRRCDVQVLAASHAELDAEVAAQRFRADLLYRLNTVRVDLPPLRERSDFARCVRALLAGIGPGAELAPDALPLLAAHRWPGNFRELRTVLTRALLLGDGRHIGPELLRRVLPAALPAEPDARSALQQLSCERVHREVSRCGGSISRAARQLGISRTTVYRYLRELRPQDG